MNSPYRFSGSTGLVAPDADRPLQTDRRAHPEKALTRRYEIAYLTRAGEVWFDTVTAPATPVFEDAFGAFGRGTLITTTEGPVAVEDILPGVRVETVNAGAQTLLWVGSMTLLPQAAPVLMRVPSDSFGMGRPMPDLMLGPRARLLYKNASCVAIMGATQAFAPATGFADGETVVPITPTQPVQVYHLCFRGQQTILANGLEAESYHPGPDLSASLAPEMMHAFLSLFPHIGAMRDFGALQTGRVTRFELEQMRSL